MKNQSKTYRVIGLMSGTSLDGLDIAYCVFKIENNKWNYSLLDSTTISYSDEWRNRLTNCMSLSPSELDKLSIDLGIFWGKETSDFITQNKLEVDFIASHGHTVFHQPEKGITVQVGDAKEISRICGTTTISDFRTKNVQLGGQGAPLVPIGDKLLFSEFDYCLNLGGISNISFDDLNGERKAFDISPCNLVLNHFANLQGLEYDDNGNIGRKGNIENELLNKLNRVNYYKKVAPKSLGKEDITNDFIPLMDSFDISLEDKMKTFYEHISIQIANEIEEGKCLITGGGSFNVFLIDLIKEKTTAEIILPNEELISFKEALIFAFLGTLRIRNETNILKSYTGAREDSCSGRIDFVSKNE